MQLHDEGARVLFRGKFEIHHEGEAIEAFSVEVELSPESPMSLPVVREIDGRIPRLKDKHHVNDDGTLCVLLPDYFLYHQPEGITLADFLRRPLRDHLAGQAAVLRGKQWPEDEWAHGPEGVIQFYQDVLGIRDPEILLRLLLSEASRRSKRQMKCQCGSGRKRRHCHGEALRALGRGPNYTSATLYLDAKLKGNLEAEEGEHE